MRRFVSLGGLLAFVVAVDLSPVMAAPNGVAVQKTPAPKSATSNPADAQAIAALSELENRILAIALQQKEPGKIQEYGRYFMAVRESRLLSQQEKLAETKAGLTRYTQLKSIPDAAAKLVATLMRPGYDEKSQSDRRAAKGAAMIVLMERLGYDQRQITLKGGALLAGAFAKALPYEPQVGQALVATAKQMFGYEQLLADSQEPRAAYQGFLALPGTRITIKGLEPVKPGDNGTETIQVEMAALPIVIKPQMFLSKGAPSFSYRKGNVSLSLKSLPFLMESRNIAWPFETMTFSSSETLRCELDGQELALKDGVYPIGSSLKLTGEQISLTTGTGSLQVSGRRIAITLEK